MSFPHRGEIFWGPGKKKIRPLLVVSNDQGNLYSGNIVVIPGTTRNIEIIYPVEVLVKEVGLPKPTKFQADSIFTIYKSELGNKIGKISKDSMTAVSTALRTELML